MHHDTRRGILTALLAATLATSGTATGATPCPDEDHMADMTRQASEQDYNPPASGKLDANQVQAFVEANRRAMDLVKAWTGEETDRQCVRLVEGLRAKDVRTRALIVALNDRGGNWTEHTWIGSRLWTAMQIADVMDGQSTDHSVHHNQALFENHEPDVRAAFTWLAR